MWRSWVDGEGRTPEAAPPMRVRRALWLEPDRSRRKSLAPRGKVTVSRPPEHDPAALGEQEDSFLFTDLSGFFTNLETLGGLRRAGFLGPGPSPFPVPPHLSGVAHRSSRRLGC